MERLRLVSYDIQGMLFGILMTSFGVTLLQAALLTTGQLAGLSVLLSFNTDVSFAWIFFVINVPFYFLSYRKKGLKFTLRTIISVIGISLVTPIIGANIAFSELPTWLAAILAGCSTGVGLIALFRHQASAGGIGIFALYLQEKMHIKAGWTQLFLDALIFIYASFTLSLEAVFFSFIAALIMNLLIAWNFQIQAPKKV